MQPQSSPGQQPRRVKILQINPGDFMVLFTKGLKVVGGWKVIKGLPKDAKLVTLAAEPLRGGIILVVESEEYAEIAPTQMPPIEVVEIDLGSRHIKRPQ